MLIVSGTDALILDLRRNGGGSGETESTFASYFRANVTRLSSVVEKVNGNPQERQHWTVPYLQAPRYVAKPVYILTSRNTHSAAEALSYDLRNLRVATSWASPLAAMQRPPQVKWSLAGFSALIPNGQLISPIIIGELFQSRSSARCGDCPGEGPWYGISSCSDSSQNERGFRSAC